MGYQLKGVKMISLKINTTNDDDLSVNTEAYFDSFENLMHESVIGIHAILESADDTFKKQKDVEISKFLRNGLVSVILEMIEDFKNEKLERIEEDGE